MGENWVRQSSGDVTLYPLVAAELTSVMTLGRANVLSATQRIKCSNTGNCD
jgi:hypothetical protein